MGSKRPLGATRRDLRLSATEGMAASFMVGSGETFVPAFALAMGLGDVTAGLVATVPLLVGAVLQLVAPWAVAWLGSYRRWVIGCALAQAASFVPLAWAAISGVLPVWLVFVTASLYWAAGLSLSSAWNAWIETLVPPSVRTRYFAHRSRLSHGALLLGLLTSAAILEVAKERGIGALGFALVFVAAMGARVLSAAMFTGHQEHPPAPSLAMVKWREVGPVLRQKEIRSLLAYMLAVQVAVQVAAPYFTPFMLGPLGLSYMGYLIIIAISFLARMMVLPLLGRLGKEKGARWLLWFGGIGIVPLSGLWCLSDSFAYLLFLQVLGGLAWGAYELATLLLLFQSIPHRARVPVLAVFNLLSALALTVGSLIGGLILARMQASPQGYGILFIVSSALRLGALMLLLRMPSVWLPTARMVLRTIALRPSAGAIQRPILPTLPDTSEERSGTGAPD